MFLTGIFNEKFVTGAVLLLDGSVNAVSAGFDDVYTLQRGYLPWDLFQ